MPTITTHAPGTFCWFELHTTDDNTAQRFYASLLGWSERKVPFGEGQLYRIQQVQGQDVAAIMKMMPDMQKQGIPSNWMQYVATDNVDATAEKAKKLGATLAFPPTDVMEEGRMSVIQDPQGAMLSVWKGKKTPGVGLKGENGTWVWSELLTRDPNGSKTFYTGLFGWQAEDFKAPGPPVAPQQKYVVFKHQGTGIAGMMEIRPDMGQAPPSWMLYFRVADTDAATKRTTELGGKVYMAPQQIPTVGRFAVLADPTGGVFSVLKPDPQM